MPATGPGWALRLITLGLWVVWIITYWDFGRRMIHDLRAATSPQDALLMNAIGAGTGVLLTGSVLVTLGPLAATDALAATNTLPLVAVGSVLALAGMAGTFACRRWLGRFWTAEAALQPDHQVIDRGPYARVRHPIYTAAIALYLGTALVFAAWWSLLAFLVVAVSYALKARLEDAYLHANLPGYAAYMARVRWRLVPGLW